MQIKTMLAIMVMCGYVGCASTMMTALSWNLIRIMRIEDEEEGIWIRQEP